jgi:hypothetical protein
MSRDPEVLKVECTLALAKCLEADPEVIDPFGLACGMFFAAIDAMTAEPREMADVEAELLKVRERSALNRLPQAPRPRRKPEFSGEGHAHNRPRPDPATPARRKGDTQDATLAADLEAEARRARDRERQQRAAAHQHPWE